ncbi:MAG: hypothetical protein ACI8QZ_003522 [Chlamydiales bacterium]|jgi:hypothetical protein
MFENVVQKIIEHSSYGPAVQGAIAQGLPLALNYHTHGPGSGYCVSVCAVVEPLIEFLGKAELEELAHIRGLGQTEEECGPVTDAFAQAICQGLGVERTFQIYLNGAPLPE